MSRLTSSLLFQLLYVALLLQTLTPFASGTETDEEGMGLLGSVGSASAVQKGHVPLDVDGYPAAPPELELEQVHIYVRHGTFPPYVVMTVQSARM